MTKDNPILTLSYYPPETFTKVPLDEPKRMHVFIRAPDDITDDTLRELGLYDHPRMDPGTWFERYEATTKHLTTVTIKYESPELQAAAQTIQRALRRRFSAGSASL